MALIDHLGGDGRGGLLHLSQLVRGQADRIGTGGQQTVGAREWRQRRRNRSADVRAEDVRDGLGNTACSTSVAPATANRFRSGPRPTLPEQENEAAGQAVPFRRPAIPLHSTSSCFATSTLRQPRRRSLLGLATHSKKFHEPWKSGRKIQREKYTDCIHSRIRKINCNSQLSA